MSYFNWDDTLYEIQEVSSVDEPGFQYELWDLSAGTGGKVGRITVPDEDMSGGITIQLDRILPVEVLFNWMSSVPELRQRNVGGG